MENIYTFYSHYIFKDHKILYISTCMYIRIQFYKYIEVLHDKVIYFKIFQLL